MFPHNPYFHLPSNLIIFAKPLSLLDTECVSKKLELPSTNFLLTLKYILVKTEPVDKLFVVAKDKVWSIAISQDTDI